MAWISSSLPLSKAQDDELKQTTGGVEAQPKLACGAVLVQVCDEDRIRRRDQSVIGVHPVLQGRGVDLHATYARMAARISSDLLTWSCAARSFSAVSNASSIRTGTT